MVRWAFHLLGIEVTKDKKLIKKAYAAKVKLCHPEEQPEEWARLHEAYQAALKYAQTPEEFREESRDVRRGWEESRDVRKGWEESVSEHASLEDDEEEEEPSYVPPPEARISPDPEYDEMFHEAQQRWAQESSPEVNISPDLEYDKMFQEAQQQWMQESLLQEGLFAKRAILYRKRERRKKLLLIFAALVIGFLIIGMAGLRKEHAVEDDVKEMAAAYLNEKYGGASYSTKNLEVEEEGIIGDFINKMDSYAIRARETGVVIAYAMRGERDKEGKYAFFDNIQEAEIREGFENAVNTATGHAEGLLFWDSSTTDTTYGGIGDGYFHTKYEGDFMDFIVHEAARRADTPTGDPKALATEYQSMNGICDYYLPDPAVQTIEERLKMQELTEDPKLKEALDQCAADYKVQLRCSVLPETLFEKRIAQAEENRYNVFVLNDVHETLGMQPAMSFLMLTGWYVSLPPEDERLLGIANGMYMQPVLAMGDGISGTESSIGGQGFSGDPEWMTGSIVKTETPETLEITEEERQQAVSFRLADGYVLKNNYALAIRKDQYGIADTGYKVLVTKQVGMEMDVADKHLEAPAGTTYEKYVCNYLDAGAILRQNDVIDGEGYIFIEYQAAENASEADIITVINP